MKLTRRAWIAACAAVLGACASADQVPFRQGKWTITITSLTTDDTETYQFADTKFIGKNYQLDNVSLNYTKAVS
jgi:hypothetical protein